MVQKFFCWELITAGLVIGWFGFIESISSVVSNAIVLENIDIYVDPTKFPDIDPVVIKRTIINLLGTNIALNVIDCLASGMLIVGTIKKNHLFLLPWLVNSGISLLFLIIVTIVCVILAISAVNKASIGGVIFAIVLFSLLTALLSYIWIAIYSLYKHLRQNEPQSEYSRLIDGNTGPQPIYTRA